MGLESVTKISDLNPLWPLGSDQKLAGDDHIRNIKLALQTVSFLKSIQTFTTSGTWTRPAGVRTVLVYCLGGGAGGHGGQVAAYAGGGGGSGGVGIKLLDVTSLPTVTVSIGAPGLAGTNPAGIGGAAGITAFSVGATFYCMGAGGLVDSTGYNRGGPGAPVVASVGDIRFAGGAGNPGGVFVAGSGAIFPGGAGGGNGGGVSGGSYGDASPNSGGGGAGGYCSATTSLLGGAGGSGYCVVLEFGQ